MVFYFTMVAAIQSIIIIIIVQKFSTELKRTHIWNVQPGQNTGIQKKTQFEAISLDRWSRHSSLDSKDPKVVSLLRIAHSLIARLSMIRRKYVSITFAMRVLQFKTFICCVYCAACVDGINAVVNGWLYRCCYQFF